MPTITVVGDALLDVHAVPAGPLRPGGDVPAEIRLEPGGQGANVAVRLARRGLDVRLACALGPDPAGDILRARLAADGVDTVIRGSPATGVVVVLRDETRDRTMLSQRVPLGPGLSSAVATDAGWLIVSGYVLVEPDAGISGSGDSPRRALLGCSLDRSQAPTWLDRARSLAPHLVIVNADEAGALTGSAKAPTQLAVDLATRLTAVAVVTHATGAAAALDGEALEVAARASGPVVDATGAGDALAAGLIAGLVDGPWPPSRDDLERAMSAGVDLAAAVARVSGAQAPVPGEGGST